MFFRPRSPLSPAAIERDLTHAAERVREAAVRELGRVPPDFPDLANRLERALTDTSPFVRTTAMYSLLEQHLETRLQDAVLQALDDPASRVREAAVIALAALDDATVRPRLAALLDDADPAVRHAAILTAAEKGYFDLQDRMAEKLADDADDEVRAAAAAALAECPDPPEEILRRAAETDSCRDVRFEAAMALARHRAPSSAKHLLPFLAHDDLFTDAVEQLCRLADESVRAEVARFYERRFLPAARKLLLGALLCRLGDERARPYMEKKTRALFQETRVWAIHALGLAQTAWARELLVAIAAQRSGTQEAETAADELADMAPDHAPETTKP